MSLGDTLKNGLNGKSTRVLVIIGSLTVAAAGPVAALMAHSAASVFDDMRKQLADTHDFVIAVTQQNNQRDQRLDRIENGQDRQWQAIGTLQQRMTGAETKLDAHISDPRAHNSRNP